MPWLTMVHLLLTAGPSRSFHVVVYYLFHSHSVEPYWFGGRFKFSGVWGRIAEKCPSRAILTCLCYEVFYLNI